MIFCEKIIHLGYIPVHLNIHNPEYPGGGGGQHIQTPYKPLWMFHLHKHILSIFCNWWNDLLPEVYV